MDCCWECDGVPRVAGNVVRTRSWLRCGVVCLKWTAAVAVAVDGSGQGSACRAVRGRNHW